MDRPVVATFVDLVRRAPLDVLIQLASVSIKNRLPHDFIATLDNEEKLDAIRACLIVSVLTDGSIVPRTFQLEASLAILRRHDSVIIAGTGSGKTLCLLIPILLRLESISLTISPLKRLQTTQVSNITGTNSTGPMVLLLCSGARERAIWNQNDRNQRGYPK